MRHNGELAVGAVSPVAGYTTPSPLGEHVGLELEGRKQHVCVRLLCYMLSIYPPEINHPPAAAGRPVSIVDLVQLPHGTKLSFVLLKNRLLLNGWVFR